VKVMMKLRRMLAGVADQSSAGGVDHELVLDRLEDVHIVGGEPMPPAGEEERSRGGAPMILFSTKARALRSSGNLRGGDRLETSSGDEVVLERGAASSTAPKGYLRRLRLDRLQVVEREQGRSDRAPASEWPR